MQDGREASPDVEGVRGWAPSFICLCCWSQRYPVQVVGGVVSGGRGDIVTYSNTKKECREYKVRMI